MLDAKYSRSKICSVLLRIYQADGLSNHTMLWSVLKLFMLHEFPAWIYPQSPSYARQCRQGSGKEALVPSPRYSVRICIHGGNGRIMLGSAM